MVFKFGSQDSSFLQKQCVPSPPNKAFVRLCSIFGILKEHGALRVLGAHNVNVTQLMGDADDNRLKEELETCKYSLVDSETENGRHRVYNFAMDTLDQKNLRHKLDDVFDSLKCAPKMKISIGSVLKNVRQE